MERRRGLKIGPVLIAIVVVAGGLVVAATLLRGEEQEGAAESPLPTVTAAATVDVSEKIEPELVELVELEEQRPGQAREEAAWDILFDQQGRVGVFIGLDPDVIVVHRRLPGNPAGQQEASQLILAYGGEIYGELHYSNLIVAYVPLDQIKALAQEEAVTDVSLGRKIMAPEDPVAPDRPVSPEGLLQDDPNAHIRADLLWERGYGGDGIKVAIVDTGFDIDYPAFSYANGSAVDMGGKRRL
jgi:subtilisin family serine protease